MIIYVEKTEENNPYTLSIIEKFQDAKLIYIDNYKNIFDTNIVWNISSSIIIARLREPLIEAPIFYGYSGKWYFLKNSLNCVYDCSYCYLQWIFKNDTKVFFVNFECIKNEINKKLSEKNTDWVTWFYSSDYSDNLATDTLTGFTREFIPFFSQLENAKMEIRTKSTNIDWLLKLTPTNNVEIAFSLSPESVTQIYESGTPSLSARLQAINRLLGSGWQVWIRFMPLIGIENYQSVYREFLEEITTSLDMRQIYSVFVWWLLYTDDDYKKMQKKQSSLQILYHMDKEKDGFHRQDIEVRKWFYDTFSTILKDKKVNICFDWI